MKQLMMLQVKVLQQQLLQRLQAEDGLFGIREEAVIGQHTLIRKEAALIREEAALIREEAALIREEAALVREEELEAALKPLLLIREEALRLLSTS